MAPLFDALNFPHRVHLGQNLAELLVLLCKRRAAEAFVADGDLWESARRALANRIASEMRLEAGARANCSVRASCRAACLSNGRFVSVLRCALVPCSTSGAMASGGTIEALRAVATSTRGVQASRRRRACR